MISGRSASAPTSGSGGFSYDGSYISYRSGELGVGGFSPSPPVSYPWRVNSRSGSVYEGSSDWKQTPPSGGHPGRNNSCRKQGSFYGHSSNVLNRGRSGRTPRAWGGQGLRFVEEEKNVRGDHLLGAFMPESGLGPPCSSYNSSNLRSARQSSGRNRYVTNSAKGSAEIPLLLAPALTEQQSERVLASLQKKTTPSQSGIKVKVLELLEYWMSDVSTGTAIRELIAEAYQDAGLADGHTVVIDGNNDALGGVSSAENGASVKVCYKQEEGKVSHSEKKTSSLSSSSISLSLGSEGNGRWGKKDWTVHYQESQKQHQRGDLNKKCENSVERENLVDITVTSSINRTCMDGFSDKELMMARTPSGSSDTSFISFARTTSSETLASRLATYDDIPCFYDSTGLLRGAEEILIGLTCKKKVNPHLNLVEGMIVPKTVYTPSEDRVSFIGVDAPLECKNKPAPMSSLKTVEEQDVLHFIQRELSHLPAPPEVNQGKRLPGRRENGYLDTGNGLQMRRELSHRQLLTQAIQRICTECFGLPKYFAFLIEGILQVDVDVGSGGMKSIRGRIFVRSSSSSAMRSSHTSQRDVVVEQLHELFKTYLRGRCIVRRVFEILILSSRVYTGIFGTPSVSGNSWVTMPVKNHHPRQEKQQGRSYLLPTDFCAYISVLLEHHPGLVFLKQTPDFQTRYLETVIYRIFYDLDRFNRGRITYAEMECSCFLDSLRQVDAADDINSVLLYFSYEHFYVLYCRFWELDRNRDMLLSRQEFMRYAPEGLMNPIIAERVFNGVGRRTSCRVKNRINYEDFVWFCLSEEDKSTPTAIRYWFRILDLDGDGVLSVYELRSFYDVTMKPVMARVVNEIVAIEDVFCQIFDMFGVEASCGLRLRDLLSKPEAAAVAVNMLTNVVRFLQFEERDPFVAHQDRLRGGPEQSKWDRFARAEYDRLSKTA